MRTTGCTACGDIRVWNRTVITAEYLPVLGYISVPKEKFPGLIRWFPQLDRTLDWKQNIQKSRCLRIMAELSIGGWDILRSKSSTQ